MSGQSIGMLILGLIGGYITCSLLGPNGVTTPIDPSQICDSLDFVPAKSKIISLSQANKMYQSYSEKRVPLIEDVEKPDDSEFMATRYAFYDFEVIKNYFDYLTCIDSDLRMDSPDTAGISGVKIYFAHYPDSSDYADGKDKKNTIFMLPTVYREAAHVGFSYNRGSNNAISFNEIRSRSLQKSTNRNSNTENDEGEESLIFNEAGLHPPPSLDVDFQ